MRSVLIAGAAAALALVLTACGSDTGSGAANVSSTTGDAAQLLAANGLSGLTGEQVVERLDRTNADRGGPLSGSVKPDRVELVSGSQQADLPLDRFYLSVAPYVTSTHECYNHNLATCQGELAGTTIAVTITDQAGASLVDTTVTTYENGFAGFWLPKDITGTITVTYGGKKASSPIATGAQDPTCLTTLKLV